jgi:hypothetical protein
VGHAVPDVGLDIEQVGDAPLKPKPSCRREVDLHQSHLAKLASRTTPILTYGRDKRLCDRYWDTMLTGVLFK